MAAKLDSTKSVPLQKDTMMWKNRTEVAKKSEVLHEIRKLDTQIQALEREKGTHIYSKRSDFHNDFSHLEELDGKSKMERKTEKIKLLQQLEKVSHMVRRFQNELKDVRPTPEFVEKLKVIMEDIEGTINNFKLQQRQKYEELMMDERLVRQELQAMEKRFEAWSNTSNGSSSARLPIKPPSTARDIMKDLPPEVAAFERFLQQTGGNRGGWDEYDHQTFLKFRNRYKGKGVFIDHLVPVLLPKTETVIQDHESWYQEYLYLYDTKKDAIKQWRLKKQEEKEDMLTQAQNDSGSDGEKERKSQYEERMKIEKRERFSRLNAWKVEKELIKARETEKKLREDLANNKKVEEEKKRQMELKIKVEEYRQHRQEEEEFFKQQDTAREEEEMERKKQLSAREIVRFRERDQKAVSERVMKHREMEEEERLKEERKKERIKRQVEMYVPNDPNRLYKPTKGWKERLKATEETPSAKGPLIQMPHRAVPSWRQGLH